MADAMFKLRETNASENGDPRGRSGLRCRSVGFVEIDPYCENSMKAFQPPESLGAYRNSAIFMELSVRVARSDVKSVMGQSGATHTAAGQRKSSSCTPPGLTRRLQ
jgi:hypothetical protein